MQTVPLVLRSVAPLGVLAVVSGAVVTHSALGYQMVQAGTFGSLIALYGAASLTDNRRSLLAAAIAAAALGAFFVTNRGRWEWFQSHLDRRDVGGGLGRGNVRPYSRRAVEAVGARAASLEREQEARAREAVADERARMARELHDIVGHALNVVVIQAAGARRVLETSPHAARDALASIESTGREALFEMERMLGVLRSADGDAGAPGPQPGLAQLDGLAAHVTEAGHSRAGHRRRRSARDSGQRGPLRLPNRAGVAHQLSQALRRLSRDRHSPLLPRTLELEIVDDGRGSSGDRGGVRRGGRGHVGMRERVALFGGEINMGPRASGNGYSVSARLPFKNTSA